MKRDTRDWLMGFSVSFGVTFLGMIIVLGTVGFLSYTKTHGKAEGSGRLQAAGVNQGPDTYLPSAADRLTILVAGGEEGEEPHTYLLFGFLPDQGRIALCVLPASTYVEYGGEGSTLGRLWQKGGLGYARKGLADYLGIPIHRHAGVGPEGLDALLDWCGGAMDYDLTTEVDGVVGGRRLAMSRGRWQLDGQRMLDLLAYSGYPGGERERSARGALLLCQAVERALPVFLDEEAGAGFQETALSVLDTDLSAADCLERKAAVEFLARLEMPSAVSVFLEGSLSRDYTVFYLTDGCKARIGENYGEPGAEAKWKVPLPQAPEPVPVPVQEPVTEEKKPILDSGEYPPIGDAGALVP